MKDKLKQIREKALASIENSEGLNGLNDVRVAFLGKKGEGRGCGMMNTAAISGMWTSPCIPIARRKKAAFCTAGFCGSFPKQRCC